jgi:hypothetical protein
MVVLEEQARSAKANHVAQDAFVRFANVMLLDIGAARRYAGAEQKQRVRNFLFQSGLATRKN